MKRIYISIPYSGMMESAYEQVNKFTTDVLDMGHNPFSPITHSHPLKKYGLPAKWDFWKNIDLDWIDACDEVWVLVPEEGDYVVHQSTGVQAEIEYAIETGKPVKAFHYMGDKPVEILPAKVFKNGT